MLGLNDTAAKDANASVAQGRASWAIRFAAITPTMNASGVQASFFQTTGTPVDGGVLAPGDDWSAYVWRPLASSLDADGAALARLDGGYVWKQQWVSGSYPAKGPKPPVDVAMSIPMSGRALELHIHRAALAATLAADGSGAKDGDIGGVLSTEEIVVAFKAVAGTITTSLCKGSALEGVVQQIRQASDILLDGTQDPLVTCNAVSIGLGFEAKRTSLGDPAADPPASDPCSKK